MALQTFAIKLGVLIRSGVVAFGLPAIGFVANADPTPGVVEGISSITTLAPAAGCIISAVIFYFGYKIKDNHVPEMEKEIAARKTEA